MSILELQVEALMKLCTAADEGTRKEAREEIAYLLQRKPAAPAVDPEERVRSPRALLSLVDWAERGAA